jgi:2-amino-4-hydroxy-6-hydroxymethyldihydropteridine diphosphokinase
MSTPPNIPVYIALGSNLGDRAANLREAIRRLPPLVTVLAQSPVYRTKPWGYTDQPDFLNQVIFAETACTPEALLAHLKEIEITVGRTPTFRYGPRVVDLDILFFGDLTVSLPDLEIPHPRLHERAFVLVPLNDLNPGLRHPVTNQTVGEMLAQVDASGVVRL